MEGPAHFRFERGRWANARGKKRKEKKIKKKAHRENSEQRRHRRQERPSVALPHENGPVRLDSQLFPERGGR